MHFSVWFYFLTIFFVSNLSKEKLQIKIKIETVKKTDERKETGTDPITKWSFYWTWKQRQQIASLVNSDLKWRGTKNNNRMKKIKNEKMHSRFDILQCEFVVSSTPWNDKIKILRTNWSFSVKKKVRIDWF